MRQREGEVLGDQLLDVGTLDVVGLLELDNAEDLSGHVNTIPSPWIILRKEWATYVDRSETGTVAGSHVGVQGLDGTGS